MSSEQTKKKKKFQVDLTVEDSSLFRSVMNKIINPDLRSDRVDQPDLDQPQIKPIAPEKRTIDTGVHNTPVNNVHQSILFRSVSPQELDSIGYTKLANTIFDTLPRMLSPYDFVVYLRLYRLSYGFHTNTCIVGTKGLMTSCNISDRQVIKSVDKLVSLDLIKILEVINTKTIKGTRYEVKVPLNNVHQRTQYTSEPSSVIKEINHDDSLNKDHHQSEVMMIYKNLTGNNSWTKSDSVAYEKIKHLPLQEVSQLIKSVLEKAHQKPNSLAYFVKAYQTPTKANPANKSAIKAKLAAIVERKREAHVGSRYSIADLSFDVKAECLREGIIFDNELFNDILDKK